MMFKSISYLVLLFFSLGVSSVSLAEYDCTFPDSPKTMAPGWVCDEPVAGFELFTVGSGKRQEEAIMSSMSQLTDNLTVRVWNAVKLKAEETGQTYDEPIADKGGLNTLRVFGNIRIENNYKQVTTTKSNKVIKKVSANNELTLLNKHCNWTMNSSAISVDGIDIDVQNENNFSQCSIEDVKKELRKAGIQIAKTRVSPNKVHYVLLGLSESKLKQLENDEIRGRKKVADMVAKYVTSADEHPQKDEALEAYKKKDYLKAAELGHVKAMRMTGLMYASGRAGLKKDYSEAYKWYIKAAEKGDAIAMQYVGAFNEKGVGVDRNLQSALSWYKKARDSGYKKQERIIKDISRVESMMRQEASKADQQNLDKKYKEAVQLFDNNQRSKALLMLNQLADKNHINSLVILAKIYDEGVGLGKNASRAKQYQQRALKEVTRRAKLYELDMMEYLSQVYQKGYLGQKYDDDKAKYWFEKAMDLRADQATRNNDTNQMRTIGRIYLYHKSYKLKDPVKGIEWLKKAAKLGDSQAMISLAKAYDDVTIKKIRNESLAQTWFQKAKVSLTKKAKSGDVQAMYLLGELYVDGDLGKNIEAYKKGTYWLEKSASKGNIDATWVLAIVYSGDYFFYREAARKLKNEKKAFKWSHIYYDIQKDVPHITVSIYTDKYVDILQDLGDAYWEGKHTRRDINKARKLYRTACHVEKHYTDPTFESSASGYVKTEQEKAKLCE